MNKYKDNILYLIIGILFLSVTSVCAKEIPADKKYSVTLHADKAQINKKTTKIIGKAGSIKVKLVTLKDDINERASNETENDQTRSQS